MTSTPYLYVSAFKRHLILRGIACSQHIGSGRYQVRVRDAWVAMDAGENRINTSGAPVRGMELYADESTAEALIVLETALRISGGPFQMETPEKGIFDVFVKRLWSTLHLLGDFPHDPETNEIPFTEKSFGKGYEEAQRPRDVFAELFAARHVLAHLDAMPPDQVHPALQYEEVQEQITRFGTEVDKLIKRAQNRTGQKGDS